MNFGVAILILKMEENTHIQNIQTNKVIGKNEEHVFYFTEKKLSGLFGQSNNWQA